MQRRRFTALASALVAMALLPVSPLFAHTPYRQWDIFRKRHLQILSSHSDLEGDATADRWADILGAKLPLARAMVSRARDVIRSAALLKTNQAKIAILSYAHAKAMFEGTAPFEEYKPMPLQVLLDNGTHLLVARDDLPLAHAFLVVVTLLEEAKALQLDVPLEGKFGMNIHPGARAAALGETITLPEDVK